MASKRAGDKDDRAWFRSDRLVYEGGQWFFLTREGTVEGPYESQLEASQRLETYVRVMSSELLEAETEELLRDS